MPRGERYSELRAISQPTLVVNGNNDIMVPTIKLIHALSAHPECRSSSSTPIRAMARFSSTRSYS